MTFDEFVTAAAAGAAIVAYPPAGRGIDSAEPMRGRAALYPDPEPGALVEDGAPAAGDTAIYIEGQLWPVLPRDCRRADHVDKPTVIRVKTPIGRVTAVDGYVTGEIDHPYNRAQLGAIPRAEDGRYQAVLVEPYAHPLSTSRADGRRAHTLPELRDTAEDAIRYVAQSAAAIRSYWHEATADTDRRLLTDGNYSVIRRGGGMIGTISPLASDGVRAAYHRGATAPARELWQLFPCSAAALFALLYTDACFDGSEFGRTKGPHYIYSRLTGAGASISALIDAGRAAALAAVREEIASCPR